MKVKRSELTNQELEAAKDELFVAKALSGNLDNIIKSEELKAAMREIYNRPRVVERIDELSNIYTINSDYQNQSLAFGNTLGTRNAKKDIEVMESASSRKAETETAAKRTRDCRDEKGTRERV